MMTDPKPIVSDAEVQAAKVMVDKFAEFAGHKPVPDFIVRFILEEAAIVRMRTMSLTNGELKND
jgi:hypothetical protein